MTRRHLFSRRPRARPRRSGRRRRGRRLAVRPACRGRRGCRSGRSRRRSTGARVALPRIEGGTFETPGFFRRQGGAARQYRLVSAASRPSTKGCRRFGRRGATTGWSVLGMPSNDFGNQEPGSEAEIQAFCETTFSIDFPMTAKQTVVGPECPPALPVGGGGDRTGRGAALELPQDPDRARRTPRRLVRHHGRSGQPAPDRRHRRRPGGGPGS